MFTSLAIGVTAVATIFLTVAMGLSVSIVLDGRQGYAKEAANTVWNLILLIVLTSPIVGLAVLLWQKALA